MATTTQSASPPLLGLANELLLKVVCSLDSVDDLLTVNRTCRQLKTLSDSKCHAILAALRAQPHAMLAMNARKLADWATANNANRQELEEVVSQDEGLFKDGLNPLMKLCRQRLGVEVQDVENFIDVQSDLLEPLIDRVAREPQHTPESNMTMNNPFLGYYPFANLRKALYDWVVYTELFHHDIDIASNDSFAVKPLCVYARIDTLARLLPLEFHHSYMPEAEVSVDFSTGYRDINLLLRSVAFVEKFRTILPPVLPALPNDRTDWVIRVLQHQGLDAIRLLMSDDLSLNSDLIARVSQEATALSSSTRREIVKAMHRSERNNYSMRTEHNIHTDNVVYAHALEGLDSDRGYWWSLKNDMDLSMGHQQQIWKTSHPSTQPRGFIGRSPRLPGTSTG